MAFNYLEDNDPRGQLQAEDEVGAGVGAEKFDMTLGVANTPAGFRLELSYRANLYSAATIARMCNHYVAILENHCRKA